MLHAVIMAGGTGTRFWPESRARRPKQLLRLLGDRTMLRWTLQRLGDLIPPERVMVATTAPLADAIAAELPELPRSALLIEPCKRNTAPCIGLAALEILRRDPEATMAILPADQVIEPAAALREALGFAEGLIEERPERLITLGIRPTYPAETFGYIERGEALRSSAVAASPQAVYRVRQFREKPNAALAREFLSAGTFYWNAGIFVWKARTILDAVGRYEPEMHKRLLRIDAAAGSPEHPEVLQREFEALKNISIDYAVMERAGEVLVIEATFQWDDMGSWQSLARLRGADQHGNTVAAKHLGLNTTGTIIRASDEHLIVTVGVQDCIIVHTPDATLVANRHDEEAIRRVVELLEQKGWIEYL